MSNIYTVKEAYKVLMFEIASLSNPICLRAHHKSILSKFFLFVRSLIDNRNTIKDDLFRRGVIGKVGCSVVVKSRRYIFFERSGFSQILGVQFATGLEFLLICIRNAYLSQISLPGCLTVVDLFQCKFWRFGSLVFVAFEKQKMAKFLATN